MVWRHMESISWTVRKTNQKLLRSLWYFYMEQIKNDVRIKILKKLKENASNWLEWINGVVDQIMSWENITK